MGGWEMLRYVGNNERPEGGSRELQSDHKGKESIQARKSIKSEILFCERVWHFLRPGTGRAGG